MSASAGENQVANVDPGCVGVGGMGGLMAPRLLDNECKMMTFDKSAAAVERSAI